MQGSPATGQYREQNTEEELKIDVIQPQFEKQDMTYSLEKPLDLVLNLRFQNGNYMKPRKALEAYGEEIVVQKEGFEEDRKGYEVTCDKCYLYKSRKLEEDQQSYASCECSRQMYKAQRPLDYRDGLLYMLGRQKGKIKTEEKSIHKTLMLICVTMYNEDFKMLERTLGGVQENLEGFKQLGISPEQIAVVVMQDGIEKNSKVGPFYEKIDEKLGLSGDLKHEEEKQIIERYKELKEDRALLMSRTFKKRVEVIKRGREKTTDPKKIKENKNFPLNVQKNVAQCYQTRYNFLGKKKDGTEYDSLTLFFCNKHLNGQKLSSHMWFFQGFCRYLQPKYLSLIDVGTQPDKMGLVNYYKAMEADKNIGGVSGFMGLYFDDEQDEQSSTKTWHQKYGPNSASHRFSNNFLKPSGSADNKVRLQQIEEERKNINQKIEQLEDKQKKNKALDPKDEKLLEEYKQEKLKINQNAIDRKKNKYNSFLSYIYLPLKSFFAGVHLSFDIRRAQVVEYAIAHLLDKNFEAQFRFLNVLPGAWSAYRFEALTKAHEYKQDILEKRYLITHLQPENKELENSIEATNMYLAEDRLLCLALFTQQNSQYTLKYVPDALAKTDAIDNNIEFMGQRRRWINSSFFAFNYVFRNYSDHISLKSGTHIMMLLSRLNQYNAFYMVAFYSFVLYTCSTAMFVPLFHQEGLPIIVSIIPNAMILVYAMLIILLVFLSLNYKVDKKSDAYKTFNFVSGMFGLYNFLISCFTIFSILDQFILTNTVIEQRVMNDGQADVMKMIVLAMAIVGMGSIFVLFLALVVQGRQGLRIMGEMLFSFYSYFYFSATYSHTLVIYAFCNIDDNSWGTKGADSSDLASKFQDKKNEFVAKWMFKNALLCYLLVAFNDFFAGRSYILIGLGLYGVGQIGFKFIFAFYYHMKYFCYSKGSYTRNAKRNLEKNRVESQLVSSQINQQAIQKNYVQVQKSCIQRTQIKRVEQEKILSKINPQVTGLTSKMTQIQNHHHRNNVGSFNLQVPRPY